MFKTIGLIIGGLILVFLGYVATREGKFRYERSGLIQAPPEKIFPYISDFKKGGLWSPYEQMDPNMKKSYSGTDGQAGSTMEFEGNQDAGSGKLEILNIVPNQSVDIKLTMIKPLHAENLVQYTLTPEAGGTRFTWSMSGDGGFMGKLINVFIDCEAMIAGQFDVGIENLKKLVESQP
ncbi:SRPBCC family protein [Bdellovibrio sp. HCB2-146]|uniref:SRPBCC family protein n=1 Tax=Bdellovibrio sp. HCB2-146 TaxID=3394362 RepID=UPI0039BD45C7